MNEGTKASCHQSRAEPLAKFAVSIGEQAKLSLGGVLRHLVFLKPFVKRQVRLGLGVALFSLGLLISSCQRANPTSPESLQPNNQVELRVSLASGEVAQTQENSQVRFFAFNDILSRNTTTSSTSTELSTTQPESNLNMLLGDYILAVFSPPHAHFEFLQLRRDGVLELSNHIPTYQDGFLSKQSLSLKQQAPINFVLFDQLTSFTNQGLRFQHFSQNINLSSRVSYASESSGSISP